MSSPSIGIALGGGGARGLAHIGILEGLAERGIEISQVAGTSAGAIIGAMYAASRDPAWVEAHFRAFLASKAFTDLGTERLARRYQDPESISLFARRLQDHMVLNLSLHRRALIPRERLRAAMEFLVPVRTFEELLIPMRICACDMSNCELIVHQSGDLIEALCDSAGIPGVIEPRADEDRIIADGGMLSPVPVDQIDRQFVIASDVSLRGLPTLSEVNIYRLMIRAERLTQVALARQLSNAADFLFAADVQTLHWSEFSRIDELLEAGRLEARSRGDELMRAIEGRIPPVRRWWRGVRRSLNAALSGGGADDTTTESQATEGEEPVIPGTPETFHAPPRTSPPGLD